MLEADYPVGWPATLQKPCPCQIISNVWLFRMCPMTKLNFPPQADNCLDFFSAPHKLHWAKANGKGKWMFLLYFVSCHFLSVFSRGWWTKSWILEFGTLVSYPLKPQNSNDLIIQDSWVNKKYEVLLGLISACKIHRPVKKHELQISASWCVGV